MSRPCIRAHGFQSAAEELHELLAQGRLDWHCLETRLAAPELELLEAKLDPDTWVPIESYGRVLDLMAGAVPGDRAAFHRARGMRAGERLVGLEDDPSEAGDSGGGPMRVLAPAQQVVGSQRDLYNFMRWYVVPGNRPDSFLIRLEEAAALPLAAQLALEGLVAYAAAYVLDARFVVRSRRPVPDRVDVQGWRR